MAAEELRSMLVSGAKATLILLDLSAAFDTVNHDILILRLQKLGVSSLALSLIKSYLNNR